MGAVTVPKIFLGLAAVAISAIVLVLVLTLPETFSCEPKDHNYFVRTLEKPALHSVLPFVVCTAQNYSELVLFGRNFVRVNGHQPRLFVAGNSSYHITTSDCQDCMF